MGKVLLIIGLVVVGLIVFSRMPDRPAAPPVAAPVEVVEAK